MNYHIILYITGMQVLIANVWSISFYSITAPGLLKSNRKYTVAVTLDHAEDQCTILVSIEGLSFNASQDVQLKAYETKLIDFYPPQLIEGKYKLIAEGKKGLTFRNETELLTELDTGPRIYIQTDRAAYKPGDLVQFRVVILDEHTRPLKISEPIRIDILDTESNRVKQFKDITLVKGVFTGKFQLSQRPAIGSWSIEVKITGKYSFHSSKLIRVGQYILPKFRVHIDTAEHIVQEDGIVKAFVYGKYTFGKYVEGIANIQLWEVTNKRTLLEQTQINIKGVELFEITLDRSQNSTMDMHILQLMVRITDNYSGIIRSHNAVIKVHKTRYAIDIPYTEVELYNGIPYLLKAYVSYRTGAPVLDRQTPVTLKYGNTTYRTFLEDEGVATFRFQYESNKEFTVFYKNSQQTMPDFFQINKVMFSESETYCKLKLLKEKPRFGTPIEIEVSSLHNIPYLVYVLVGHGNIIRTQHILLAPFTKSYILHLTPSIDMMPDAYLYVYYIDNGRLRSNEMKITLPNEFENKISIIAPKEVTPGQTVTLNIKAQPNSYVSILAVDLSVYLNNPSYDLNRNKILQELKEDKSHSRMKDNVLWPGVASGLVIMTNAYLLLYSDISLVDADSRGAPKLYYRSVFPETWIFQNLEVNSNTTQLTFQVPDTITTWRITAFSNNDLIGFGIVDKPVDIICTRKFFILTNLPFSVKLGEIIDIPVTIFNYLTKPVKSEITLYNDKNEFKFVEETLTNNALEQSKNANIESGSGKIVTFKIKPTQIGYITLRITALTDTEVTDGMIEKLKVEAGGVLKSFNDARYLRADNGETIMTKFSIDIPTNIISDSEYIKLEIGGNYLKPSLENFHQLVKKPTGCGEQNMVNFAPSILILQLLKSTGKYNETDLLVKKLKSFIETGYQQQLAYRHFSGGFSVFGKVYDEEESTWLTAYVMRFFIKASQYSNIESRVIDTGLEYLSKQQLQDGSFPYTGYLFMPAQKNVYGMTAFVLLTFLENRKYSRKYSTLINNAVRFLNAHIDNMDDLYSLSIIATALKAARNQDATKVLEKLNQVSQSDTYGNKWWSSTLANNANDVEITAYILMALLETPGDYNNIAKWLIEQRNELGGYASTHDTVVGLQALIKYYEQFHASNDTRIILKYTAKNKMGSIVHKGGFEVTPDNFEDLQIKELPKSTAQVLFEITGSGFVLIQLNHQYNILNESLKNDNPIIMSRDMELIPTDALAATPKFKHFLIEPQARLINLVILDLEICFMYQSPAQHHLNKTNMVLLEINLPSGFRSNAANSDILKDNDFIERIESKNDDTILILYFDGLVVNKSECVYIDGEKLNDVFDVQPVPIKMYDYYNESLSETIFYRIN